MTHTTGPSRSPVTLSDQASKGKLASLSYTDIMGTAPQTYLDATGAPAWEYASGKDRVIWFPLTAIELFTQEPLASCKDAQAHCWIALQLSCS